MGFGYGHTTYHRDSGYERESGEAVKSVFTNDMVAHVWAQRSQTFGRSNNGNLYFQGDSLYSYGSHFLVAKFLPIGDSVIVLHNSDSYGTTTSGHQSDARRAASHYASYVVPELTAIDSALDTIALYGRRTKRLAKAATGTDGQLRAARAIADLCKWLESFDVTQDREVTSRGGHYYIYTVDGNHDGVAAIIDAAGLPASCIDAAQRKRASAEAKKQAVWARQERQRRDHDAKALARLSHAAFKELWPRDGSRQWEKGDSKPWEVRQGEELARNLYRLARHASGKGWKQIAAKLREMRKEYKAHFDGRNARIHQAHRDEMARDVLRWRATGERRPDAWRFDSFPAIKRRIEKSERAERAAESAALFERWRTFGNPANPHDITARRPDLSRYEKDSEEYAAIVESILAELAPFIDQARAFIEDDSIKVAPHIHYATRSDCERYLKDRPAIALALQLESDVGRVKAKREAARRFAEETERREKWLAGATNGWSGLDSDGGALTRIRDGMLETSQGASVPLDHAIKAFRFVKLCRDRGEPWQRNGRTIRVGHFQIDSIDGEGNFVAGCHRFYWPEIERIAAIAGVVNDSGDDSAIVRS